MKKIAYLMEYPIDLPGGAQMSTFSICEGLSRHKEYGYEPVVICPKLLEHKASDYSFSVREYPMGESRLNNFRIRIGAFKKIIEEEKPDLIHIEMQESLITYSFIRKRFALIPYLFTDRGLMTGYRKRSRFFMDPALKDARIMITTTSFNKDLWEKGSDIRPLTVIPNTISSEYFGQYEGDKRKEHERLVIGLAGRICPEKDWPFACDFIDALSRSGLDYDVHIVLSTFEKGDDDAVSEIIRRVSKAVGEDHLEYGTNYTQAEMADFYYGVDIFLMTSCFESFGKAAVEAMSRRCAIVSTSVGGLKEVVALPENLYTKEEMDKGVARIKELDQNRDELERQREFYYQRYKNEYTEDKYIESHVRLYDEYS